MGYKEVGDGRGDPLRGQAIEDNLLELFGKVDFIFVGEGTPEGAVEARVGALFLRTDGGTSTTLYVKETGGSAVAATGTLTGTTIAADDTVTIGAVTYTYVTELTAPAVPYEVKVGASDSASLDNLIAAINKAAGEGTTYGTGTVAHALVTAAAGAGDTMDLTAKTAGYIGNKVATTATLTSGDWGAATLEGGSTYALTGWVAK
jgi:hypothetical protein